MHVLHISLLVSSLAACIWERVALASHLSSVANKCQVFSHWGVLWHAPATIKQSKTFSFFFFGWLKNLFVSANISSSVQVLFVVLKAVRHQNAYIERILVPGT